MPHMQGQTGSTRISHEAERVRVKHGVQDCIVVSTGKERQSRVHVLGLTSWNDF